MAIRVVQNKEENHLGEVKDLLGNSNKALIASPFISLASIHKMKNWLTSGFQELTLVTTLKEKDPDQLKKVPVLEELFRLKKLRGFRLSVNIDNQLHGKVYIGRKDANYIGAIISSANFTENGLENNHEWGVFINDQIAISDLHQQIINDASVELLEKDLVKMLQWMEDNPKKEVTTPSVDVSFIDMIEHPVNSRTGMKYWLKPLGKSPHPVPSNRLFGDSEHRVTFTKKKPTGINEGDVLIVYSVVSQQLISVFVAGRDRGILTHFDNPEDKQWPNYIMCHNETPKFGANWPKINVTLREIREEFSLLYPKATVLSSGNKLNGLQWGADHVRATEEFAEFVIRKMKDVEEAHL